MASDKKTNTNLHSAKTEKNDEFYTQLSDIQAEISHYPDKFKDKVVFCNCDDPFESNFVKYFLMNFNRLGLKELIATGYKTSTVGGTEIGEKNTPYALRVTDTSKYLVGTQKDLDIRGAKYFLQTESDKIMTPLIGNPALDENGKQIQITIKEKYTDANGKTKTKNIKQDLYYEAGDFRSDMSLELLKQSDIVVTNPPFSLFREYIAVLMQYQKDFLIIGNKNAITYKEFFPLLKNNKVWIGNDTPVNFILPDSSITKKVQGLTRWFTTLDHPKRHQMLPLDLGFVYEGHEDMYPKYDNYDAINVDKTAEIPSDYTGVMGVPISFFDKYCPEQFEIVAFRKGDDDKDLVFTREREREFNLTFVSLYDFDSRDDKECRRKDQWETYLCENNNKAQIEPIDYFFPTTSFLPGMIKSNKTEVNGEKKYARILIRKKRKDGDN